MGSSDSANATGSFTVAEAPREMALKARNILRLGPITEMGDRIVFQIYLREPEDGVLTLVYLLPGGDIPAMEAAEEDHAAIQAGLEAVQRLN